MGTFDLSPKPIRDRFIKVSDGVYERSSGTVLFLDWDGVGNHSKTTHRVFNGKLVFTDLYCTFLINKIVDDTGCSVVLSSSWRHSKTWREDMAAQGLIFPFLDRTDTFTKKHGGYTGNGDTYERVRGNVITAWLKDHPEVTKYAILDDGEDAGIGHPPENFFLTSWEIGLTKETADKVTKFLL